jgi:hypothetical protein
MRTKGYVNGKPVIVYNDSGADVSCVSFREARRLRLDIEADSTSLRVSNPSGAPFRLIGRVNVDLCLHGRKFPFAAVVLDDLETDFIVGDDFLRSHSCTLSYSTGNVFYGDLQVPVIDDLSKDDRKTYRATEGLPVLAKEDTILQPGQRRDFEGVVGTPESFESGRRGLEIRAIASGGGHFRNLPGAYARAHVGRQFHRCQGLFGNLATASSGDSSWISRGNNPRHRG